MKKLLTLVLLLCAAASHGNQDYAGAYHRAKEGRTILVLQFCNERIRQFAPPRVTQAEITFELQALSDPRVQAKLATIPFATVWLDDEKMANHPAFEAMGGKPGLAIIDFTVDPSHKLYGTVVSPFPFPGSGADPSSLKPYSAEQVLVMLDLPTGCTVSQRMMCFAVRIHPEHPQSTDGDASPLLFKETASHAQYMADHCQQGHQNWDVRFQRISAYLPGGLLAQEVAAQSWGGEPLLQACIECVHSWRQSPGHWRAVSRRQPLFGYDIRQGKNGIWYGCGIFGNRGS